MAQTYTVRAELPGDYYHAIGAVANKWAVLEYLMGKMIRAILDIDHKSARCLTGGMTARALGGTLKNLATLHIADKALCAEVIAYQKQVCEHEDRRNEFVHCVWGVPD